MITYCMVSMEKQVILSIDGATKSGWAIYSNGEIIAHGTKRLRCTTRCYDYDVWLTDIIKQYGVTNIVAEDIYRDHNHQLDRAFYVLAKLHGVLETISCKYKIEIVFLDPLRVKRHMIPSMKKHERKEDKQRMINRIRHLGYTLETDNANDEADAIGILITYLETHNIPIVHPCKEKDNWKL